MAAQPMKANGFYNAHSGLQHTAARRSTALLCQAARKCPLPANGAPFYILDLGCAQGSNSMGPLKAVLDVLDQRIAESKSRPLSIIVVHEDLPNNDFPSLFRLLQDPTASYAADPTTTSPAVEAAHVGDSVVAAKRFPHLSIFPVAVGKSFLDRLVPDGSTHLVMAFMCLHWLSKVPTQVHDSIFTYNTADAAVYEAFRQTSHSELLQFLRQRAQETTPGGNLVCHFPVRDRSKPLSPGFQFLDDAAAQLVAEGALTQQEFECLGMPNFQRPPEDVREALQATSDVWVVRSWEMQTTPHPAFEQFQSGDLSASQLAAAYMNWVQAWMEPSQLAALVKVHPEVEARALLRLFFGRYEALCAATPSALQPDYVFLWLERRGPTFGATR